MPIKKSELYSSIWESCDEVRGGMDDQQKDLDYIDKLLGHKSLSESNIVNCSS